MDTLLTEADVASHFKVGKSTVRRWRERGLLQHFRREGVIRYSPEQLLRFEKDNQVDSFVAGLRRGRRRA